MGISCIEEFRAKIVHVHHVQRMLHVVHVLDGHGKVVIQERTYLCGAWTKTWSTQLSEERTYLCGAPSIYQTLNVIRVHDHAWQCSVQRDDRR